MVRLYPLWAETASWTCSPAGKCGGKHAVCNEGSDAGTRGISRSYSIKSQNGASILFLNSAYNFYGRMRMIEQSPYGG